MEYVQERITTLHDFGGANPQAPIDRSAVIVPMTERDHASLATERVLSQLATIDPKEVIVPLRAGPDSLAAITTWLSSFDLPLSILWCSAPAVESRLDEANLGGRRGKGRDVWLALGIATQRADYVVVHDADVESYAASHVARLLFPLTEGYSFSKGYYARVENGQLYGRLFRLLYTPLVRALAERSDAAILEYLGSFRYALAGEFAATARFARSVAVHRSWGLEVGLLGEAFAGVGFDGTAQVDLGTHEHDHRTVGGPDGLGRMAENVTRALLAAVESGGVDPDYETLPRRYRRTARDFVERYAVDAAFNGLVYDRASEHEQIETYAAVIEPPDDDDRLPPWERAPIDPAAIASRAREAREQRME